MSLYTELTLHHPRISVMSFPCSIYLSEDVPTSLDDDGSLSHINVGMTRQILEGVANGTIDPSTGAKRLTAPITASLSAPRKLTTSVIFETWHALAFFAADTPPEQQGPLVDLLGAITRIPQGDLPATSLAKCSTPPEWSELPEWGWIMYDEYKFAGNRVREREGDLHAYPDYTPEERERGCKRFININAFIARLCEAKVYKDTIIALYTCQDALENEAIDASFESLLRTLRCWPAPPRDSSTRPARYRNCSRRLSHSMLWRGSRGMLYQCQSLTKKPRRA